LSLIISIDKQIEDPLTYIPNEYMVSKPNLKEEFIEANLEATYEEYEQNKRKRDEEDAKYIEASKAFKKILSMKSSDAGFDLQRVYSDLREYTVKYDINMEDHDENNELKNTIDRFRRSGENFKAEHDHFVMRNLDTLKASILKHAK